MRYILLPFKCSPFNRVALFTAQITRESLDGQGESGTAAGEERRGIHTAATAPYLGIRRLVRPSERVFPSSPPLSFSLRSSSLTPTPG